MALPASRQWLLPFHRAILSRLIPEEHEDSRNLLVILAPGLGLRKVVSTLLRVYAQPNSLILVLNASESEVTAMNHSISMLGMNENVIQDIHHDLTAKQRAQLYMSGGIVSVTSRILVVDMLSRRIPTHLLTGMVVLRAERVVPTSLEAFIIRLYRQENKDGFLKAFSNNAESFASGFSTLQTIMGQLQLREVDIWPRFHETVNRDLGHRHADVIEIHQPLPPSMRAIQSAILECLEATLAEIQRSKLTSDIDDFHAEKVMHGSFDVTIRRQLDPVWHRLSPGIKQLVGDLSTLRGLLNALISYDTVSFYAYLEAIVASNGPSDNSHQRPSPWLMSDAANVIFGEAKARLWNTSDDDTTVSLTLEEPPKWSLLLNLLDEIEQDLYHRGSCDSHGPILIMVNSERTATQLRRLLSTAGHTPDRPGQTVLTQLLSEYLSWKTNLTTLQQQLKAQIHEETQTNLSKNSPLSEAMQRKAFRTGASPNKRRRMRGGMAQSTTSRSIVPELSKNEWDQLSQVSQLEQNDLPSTDLDAITTESWDSIVNEDEMDYFGMVELSQLVVIHCYQADDDDSLLQELMPSHIILYDPNAQFVRHIELFRALYGIQDLRIYFLLCTDSVEEQMYLAGLRREKDAFEKIIRKKATMAIPLTAEGDPVLEQADDRMIRSLSTRVAGGQRAGHVSQRPTVVVDMREFRSSLPSLLHAAGFAVVPCTLQVGDYVISSDMCVERKSLSDLVQSLNSGRLYTQCEAMSTHYIHPILLIEFDQERAFTLATLSDNRDAHRRLTTPQELSVQAKLVLLTLSFPRLRLIWSSSPYASVEIISDLKQNYDEPDPVRAAAIGLDDAMETNSLQEAAMNLTPTEMLREMPGVTTKNAVYLMREAPNLQALCQLSLAQLQQVIGAEPARQLYAFLHQRPHVGLV